MYRRVRGKASIAVVGACLLFAPVAGEAKHRTLGRDELIRAADIIAVVGIDSVSQVEVSPTPNGANLPSSSEGPGRPCAQR
jgi:hypothetical protein